MGDAETVDMTSPTDTGTSSAAAPAAPPAPGVGDPSTTPLSGLPPAAAQHIEKLTVMVMEIYQALQQFIPVVVQEIEMLKQQVGGAGAPMPTGTDMAGGASPTPPGASPSV
jgi:phenylpyruvate tautomerase PptA (4-oxalocrotonate tautomerase family)